MKKIAIIQSNYIPWRGYFEIMDMAHEFVFYDSVQYTKRDWRNRNKIKTPEGIKWLTIPVEVRGKYYQKIRDVKIADKNWGQNHWNKIVHSYRKARYFEDYKEFFEEEYLNSSEEYLSRINYKFIKIINKILNIKTKLTYDSEYDFKYLNKTERLVSICKALNASEYISGKAALNYIDESLFEKENIKISWMDYSGYTEYSQLYPPFEHKVSIIDLIFNEGPNAKKIFKSRSRKSFLP